MPDSQILQYAEEHQRLLITLDRASMPGHVGDHVRSGRRHWGVLRVKPSASVATLAEELLLVWEASEAEDWIDQLGWISL